MKLLLTVLFLLTMNLSYSQKVFDGPFRNGPNLKTPDGHTYYHVYDKYGDYVKTYIRDYKGESFGGYKPRVVGFKSQPTGSQIDRFIIGGYNAGKYTSGLRMGGMHTGAGSTHMPSPTCKDANNPRCLKVLNRPKQ